MISTQAGYAAGYTPNPAYHEVCTGTTGHSEVVRVALDPSKTTYDALLRGAGHGAIVNAPEFYHVEDDHQQYLHKNPEGCCAG